jgi:histidinol-phosphate aminotransferase
LTLSEDFVRTVLRSVPDTLVALDEAYAEISGHSLASIVLSEPNGVLVRTFSKGYGLAGARVGYLVGPADITRTVETIRLPQNMTAFGIAAACRALDDQDGLRQRVSEIVAERERLSSALVSRGWNVLPSQGNFLLASPARNAVEVANWLQGAGLIVRSYPAHPRLKDWLRMSVRSPEEDDRLLRRLDAFG